MSGYQLIIIGSGPGGYVAAIRAAQLGMKTAIVEKGEALGGTCLNIGCIPSKALLDSSELYARVINSGAENGIVFRDVSLDLEAMMRRKEGVVKRLTSGVSFLMRSNGVDVFHGTGRLNGPAEVRVTDHEGNETVLGTERILLATGSTSQELPFLPFDGERVVTSTEALSFSKVPGELLVIGAGAIGLELGSVWSRLGSKVTVIEILPSVLPGWDRQIGRTLQRELGKQGIDFLLETKVTAANIGKEKAELTAVDKKGQEIALSGEKVLVAVGRKPYIEGAGLENVDVKFTEGSKKLKVDEHFQTETPGVYAIGDLIHGPMLAHKAEEEGIAAVEIMAGRAGHVNYGLIPGVVYTWPEAASVGAMEEDLEEQGVRYRKGYFPFSGNGRALAMDASAGFVKLLSEKNSDRILGAHILGPWASDLISEVTAAMEFSGSAEDLARMVHPHPTLSEALREAALGTDGRMIHGPNK